MKEKEFKTEVNVSEAFKKKKEVNVKQYHPILHLTRTPTHVHLEQL